MNLKQKLAQGETTVGSWIHLAHPGVVEIMARSGFDWLVIDLEHTAIDLRETEDMIRIIALHGVPALVRLTSNDPNQVKRVMESGAAGIVVPMVKSAAEAEAAVASIYYPPRGTRSVGLGRAQGYGSAVQKYRDWLEHEAVVIVQIEHVDAVRQVRQILTVPGVDGYLLGPYDLSCSMGIPGEFKHPDFEAALAQVREVGQACGVPGGLHIVEPDTELLAKCIKDGFTFIPYSVDIRILDVGCRAALRSIGRSV